MWRIIRENGPIFAQRKKCNFDQNKKKMCKGRVRCGSKLCKIRQFDIALCASWSSKYQISGNSIVLFFLTKKYILAIIKIGSFDPCHDAKKSILLKLMTNTEGEKIPFSASNEPD